MSKIEKAIKKETKAFERDIERIVRDSIKNKTLRTWKDKKIITIEEWNEMINRKDHSKLLEFIPEDYVGYPLTYVGYNDPKMKEKKEEWWKTYCEFLEEKKNPSYGNALCAECILNPSSSNGTKNMRNLILKTIGLDTEFPCKIVNIFNCPQNQRKEGYRLFTYERLLNVIHDALSDAKSETRFHNDSMFDVDFERGTHKGFHSDSYTANTTGRYESSLEGLEYCKVPIRSIKDIYDIITDDKKLGLLFDQYIEHVRNKPRYGSESESDAEKEAEDMKGLKKQILDLLKLARPMIKLEDMSGVNGETFEDEEKERKRHESGIEFITKYQPYLVKAVYMQRSGKCMTCHEFANIHCANCDIWVCDQDWRQHRDFHDKNKVK
jgi:hypothetical protein